MAITKIGTKLIGDGVITTVKLGSSAITRSDIQSGSVQVTHLDVTQGNSGHVDFVDNDMFIAGDATNNNARAFSFSQLKTALSLSNAARGNEGSVQFNNGTGFDGIAKITTDGIHLTASNAGKIAFAFTGISGSTGEIFADSKTGLTISAKTRLSLHSTGTVQGNQSGSLELRAAGIFPSVKPATAAVPGTYRFTFTSGSTGGTSAVSTYGPAAQYRSQYLQVASTGSEDYLFYLSDGSSTNKPSANNLSMSPTNNVFEIAVEAISGISDWRTVVTNMYNAMNSNLGSSGANIATVTYNQTASVNGTASIEITYSSIGGGVQVGSGRDAGRSLSTDYFLGSLNNQSADGSYGGPGPIAGGDGIGESPGDRVEAGSNGVTVSAVVLGTAAIAENREWLNLGASGRTYNDVFLSVLSASNTSSFHQATVDAATVGKLNLGTFGSVANAVSGSGTASIHVLNVEEATIGGVALTTARAAAAYMISGSGTASIHKLDSDEGDFRKLIATVVTGATGQFHKTDTDEGTHNRLIATVVTSSGTSTLAKIDADEGDFGKVVATNITSSGTSNLHVVTVDDVSGSSGKFHKLVVDDLSARKIQSTISTTEYFEVPQKQFIPAVSASVGAATEGAGLQIGGTAGSGSNGVASVIMGDAGSGIGADLLFKIGATQGASLSGSVSDGGQRFGITGSVSGSVGVFHSVSIATALGNQDAIFSGSSFSAQTVSGALAQVFDLDVNRANINDVDGISATFTTVSGTTLQAHTVDADKLTANDVDGASLTMSGIISGSTVTAHAIDVDKLEVRDLDFVSLSGSTTATIHKVTTDVLSGSAITVHNLDIDKLSINEIVTADVVKKQHLNNDIVKDTTDTHGGLVFANGQLSVGWKRRIFSRSTKKIVNRTQPTQGSGSLYTTCSLGETRMVSGSESVFFNGLLLTRGNGVAGNVRDADYTIDYSHGGGLQPGTYRFLFTSGGVGQEGTSGKAKAYSPLKQYIPQLVAVQSTGSNGKEYYFFYFNEAADPSPLPISASLNMEYSVLAPGAFRKTTAVEAISGVSDWRDVVSNLATAMNTELNTRADLATVSYNATSSINGTASIEITYKAGTTEGGIFVGAGNGHAAKSAQIPSLSWNPSYTFGAIESAGVGGDGTNIAGEPDTAGATVQTVVSGATVQVGTGVFLHESLTMDSDDVVVVQYLSGSHQFG